MKFSFKVSPQVEGRIFADDEGQSSSGYRAYLVWGATRLFSGSVTAQIRLNGLLTLRCVLKDNLQPVSLQDLLAEVD